MMLATLALLYYSHQIKIVRDRCKKTFVFIRRALVKLACDRIRGSKQSYSTINYSNLEAKAIFNQL